jgi:DNA-binding winged helix-turn-helix (wHTH) protein/TolB-like protein
MASTGQELRSGFRLGDHLVQPGQNRIVRSDGEARLEPRVMEVLVCLAEHAGEVVSRDTLYERVWGDLVVTDQAVTNCISELRHHLRDDRATPRFIETIPKRGYRLVAPVRTGAPESPQGGAARAGDRTSRRRALAGGLLLLVVAFGVAWSLRQTDGPALTSVAVLPFDNVGGDETLDYLRLALPDEITTLLTKSRDLAVRPFDHRSTADPLAAARARRVGHIVTGHYYFEGSDRLTLAVEAQHVVQERLVWRARITAPAEDLLAMRRQIAERVRLGLLPALGAARNPAPGPSPANDEAYQLYLHSLAIPKHPELTERAIDLLERAVELDPEFAPAWEALGLRYYEHGSYGDGGERARQQSLAAYRRALEVDPALIVAARQIIVFRTEAGDLEAAYREARRLVEESGRSAEAHFALAFVYRFGGLLEASQRHCELALHRDPYDSRLRSCAYSYLYAGELGRVQDFLALDEGSYFSHWGTVLFHLRRKDDAAALNSARQDSPDSPTRQFMEPCLQGERGAALDAPAAGFIRHWQQSSDPELLYALAPMLAYCGRRGDALQFLERAVDSNFCSYPALDEDPAWDAMLRDATFLRIRQKAVACHQRFREIVAAGTGES